LIGIGKLPIRKKIILITMLSSAVALLLASAEWFLYDTVQSRRELEASVSTLAAITADNVMSAVSFVDSKAANEALRPLQSNPVIIQGCVYENAALLAQYSRSAYEPCPSQPGTDGTFYRGGGISVLQPIRLNGGRRIGSLLLRATLEPLSARMTRDLINIGAVLLVAAICAFALSSWLQRWISGPLLALTRTTKSVSETNDYAIRAPKQTEDELGNLVDSVNEMLSEIQQRHKQELELRRQAEENNRLKDEFLATLSHELRTPLTSIVGWANILRDPETRETKIDTGLEAIDRNARAQSRLIEDLLDISGIMTGKLGLQRSETDIRQLVKISMDSIRPAAKRKDISLTTEGLDDGEVRIHADPIRLQQALGNVLANAVKFTGQGGRISVTLTTTPERVRITVADTGIGILPEFLPHVFDRFRQADSSSTRRFGGLGLGLSITRHIVEMHGGTIMASSAGLNRGTSFTIEIPRTAVTFRRSG
jgi:signal transduction histidine kinase